MGFIGAYEPRKAAGTAQSATRGDAVDITGPSIKTVGEFNVKAFEGTRAGAEKLGDSAARRAPWRTSRADRDIRDDKQ